MLLHGWSSFAARGLFALGLCLALACETPPKAADPAPSLAGRHSQAVAAARLAQDTPVAQTQPAEVPSRPVGPAETQPATVEEVYAQIPDPADMESVLQRELERALREPYVPETERTRLRIQAERLRERILARVNSIRRPRVVRLSLPDAIHRTLINSYAIQTQAYNPAVDATRIVEAEAQFDAVFFTNFNYNKQDRPGATKAQNTETDVRSYEGGIRKLLSTGMQVQASYNMTRTWTNVALQSPNPSYFNQFTVQFVQPLLRGFGLDFNRSQIELRKLERTSNVERFRQAVRETIFNVEQAYWRLMQARRNIVVSARLLANFEGILNSLQQRLNVGYDVYIVQVKLTESRLEQRQAEFVQLRNDVKNAEDALKRLLNDPQLNQGEDIEIIPVDAPTMESIVVDQLGELTAALNNRPELHVTKLAIEQAQIGIGIAKNQALPRLDLLFRYIIDGLGSNPHRAFSQLSENDFNEYVLGLEFEWPIGNRGPEAALRRARLQQAQAVSAHRDQIEGVVLDVNQAIRDLQTNFDTLGPRLRAAQASQQQVEATVARLERLDPPSLEVLLNAYETLGNSRLQLAESLASYNIALVNLERQKGTLLAYNNIAIRGTEDPSCFQPYQAIGP